MHGRHPNSKSIPLAALATLLALAGCGGGGSSAPTASDGCSSHASDSVIMTNFFATNVSGSMSNS